jgi:hypothetical protein
MDNYVKNNFTELNKFITECNNFLKENDGNTIEVSLNSSASRPADIDYNKKLSERRSSSVITYLKNNIKSPNFTIKTNNLGEKTGVTAQSSNKETKRVENCSTFTDNAIYSVNAMACRRVAIGGVTAIKKGVAPKIEPKKETSEAQIKVITEAKEKETNKVKDKLYGSVSKKVLQKLLTECDYFETIEETSPFIYNNLKEKIKYFTPAFHSTTPEGLNGRLTFLQQCVRPGETIPTIRGDGTSEVRDAKNTSFGVPPVLILRVGDFYHTKIIPENLSISYDPLIWDMNPEGIGFQPMIAKVSLSFKFVGASGLSKAVDKLQNALSFNYYANTEVYDARAEKTDDSLDDMDKKIKEFIEEKEKGKTENFDVIPVVNSYTTIGTLNIVNKTLTYSNLANDLKNSAITYIDTINSVIQENSKSYNIELISVILKTLNNTEGVYNSINNSDLKLFGIPANYQKDIDDYAKKIKDNIKNNSDLFIDKINSEFSSDKNTKFEVSKNYQLYVDSEMSKVNNIINSFAIKIIEAQENFQKVLSKALFVMSTHDGYDGYDGYVDKSGQFFVYELKNRMTIINDILSSIRENINKILPNFKLIDYDPESLYKMSQQDSLFYLLLYGSLKDKNGFENFEKQILIKSVNPDNKVNDINIKISKVFKEYWDKKLNGYNIIFNKTTTFLSALGNYTKDATTFLKSITINNANLITDYNEISSPDNATKKALLNLNGDENYDNNKNTWSKNDSNFILVKNKLMR